MSAISTYLDYIRTKIYAKDVRTAIVNAISQCYDDVNAPALQTEAMQAAVQAKIDAGEMAALTIADGSLTGAKLANGTIPTAKIADGAITTAKIADGAVTGAKVGTGTLTEDNIANKAIGTTKIDDSAVTWQKLAPQAVHTTEIADGAVTSAKLGNVAVTTVKIADKAITKEKLADDVIPDVDPTLLVSGMPADAKTVGDVISIKSDITFANNFPTWKYSFYYERSRAYNSLNIRHSRNAVFVDGIVTATALRIPLVNNDGFLVCDYNPTTNNRPEFFQEVGWFTVGDTYKVSLQLVSGTVTPSASSQTPYLITVKNVVDGSSAVIGEGENFGFECDNDKPEYIALTIKAGTYSDALFLVDIEDITEKYDAYFLKSKLEEITSAVDDVHIQSFGNWKYPFSDVRSREYAGAGSDATLSQTKGVFTIDGLINASLSRVPIVNNADFLVFSSKPTYAAYPQLFSPIDWFVVGHKYKILLYLISGSYTLVTPVSRPYFIELRYVQDGVATDIINNDDATFMCTNIPDYLGINFAKGTYSNASFLVQVVDITRLEQVDYAADFAKSIENESIKKESMPIRHAEFDTTTQQVSFIFYSDIHSNPMGIDGVERFIEKYGAYADDVLNGGDSARYDFDGDTANVNYLRSNLPSVSLTAIGNHDRAQMTGSGYNWQAHTSKEVYDKWISPFVSGWDVVQPEGASTEGYNYFYKDYKGVIRLIVLDCMCWDNIQLAWFESTLSNAKTEGLAVAVMTHWCNADFTGDRNCNWTDLDRTDSTDPQHDIFITDAACDAIDTFISDGGEFICWLTGHLHRDRIGILTDYPNQLVYVANNAGMKTTGANDRGAFYSVTFITIDPTNKMLKLARYGCNYDAYLRPKHTLCYNYATKALVSQT